MNCKWRGAGGGFSWPGALPCAVAPICTCRQTFAADSDSRSLAIKKWKDEIQRSQLTSHYLPSRATGTFLAAEDEKLIGVMSKLGLSKEASVPQAAR
jgi:hypothetical protein